MFIIDYLKYDIVGKYYIFYIILVLIIIFALVGIIGELEIKRRSEIHRIRRERKAEEEGKKAGEAMAKEAEFKKANVAIDPTLKQGPVVEPQDAIKNPTRQISSTLEAMPTSLTPDSEMQANQAAPVAPVVAPAPAPVVTEVTNPEVGEKPKDNVLVIE